MKVLLLKKWGHIQVEVRSAINLVEFQYVVPMAEKQVGFIDLKPF